MQSFNANILLIRTDDANHWILLSVLVCLICIHHDNIDAHTIIYDAFHFEVHMIIQSSHHMKTLHIILWIF